MLFQVKLHSQIDCSRRSIGPDSIGTSSVCGSTCLLGAESASGIKDFALAIIIFSVTGCLWRCPWPIRGFTADLQSTWVPTCDKLPFFGRLRRPWTIQFGDDLITDVLQSQISWQCVPFARQPRNVGHPVLCSVIGQPFYSDQLQTRCTVSGKR